MGEAIGCRGDTPQAEAIRKLIRTNKRHKKALEKKLNFTGVFRSQHQLLMFIVRHPGRSQIELARMQGISTAAIAVSLKKLEQGGYVERVVDSKDNRYNQIRITDKGMEVARYSIAVFEEMEQVMFQGFSQEDFRVLGELLDRIYANLESGVPEREEHGSEKEE